MDIQRGKVTLRIRKVGDGFRGIAIRDGALLFPAVDGADEAEVQRQLDVELGKTHPNYFGYDGAKARFLWFFRQGFAGNEYFKSERRYKRDARERLVQALPLPTVLSMGGCGEAALAAFMDTNLLPSPFERARLQQALRSDAADAFVHAAARFTLGDVSAGLRDMRAALEPFRIATWPAMTYLPFLWRPEEHMLLKPVATLDFAQRVGHGFQHDYTPQAHARVYESLLDLVQRTQREIADLAPRDRIDIQSFIWVVGAYREERDVPKD